MPSNGHQSNAPDHGSLTQEVSPEVVRMLPSNGLHPVSLLEQKPEDPRMPFLMVLLKRRLHLLPVITEVLIVIGFFVSYGIAVYHGHVEPDFPYISYTAIQPPERGFFSLFINMGAILLAANIYIKYLQTRQAFIRIPAKSRDNKINKAALIIGIISAFGLSMVANFQTVDARTGHYIGAGLTFFGGVIYCWMQTALAIRYRRWSYVAVGQLVISLVLTCSLIIFAISKAIYKIRESQGLGTKLDTLRGVYLTSTISEWLTAISLVTFVLTFYSDFKEIELKLPRVEYLDKTKPLRDYNVQRADDATAPVPV